MPSRIYQNLGFDKISIGNSHSVGLNDGKIAGWGSSAKGKLDFPAEHRYVDVSVGYSHSSAVCDDGLLVSVGHSGNGKTVTDSTIYHKSVRCSRNYTVCCAEVNSKDAIVVYGDQKRYSRLDASIYTCVNSNMGIIAIDNVSDFDVSDNGDIVVGTNSGLIFYIGNTVVKINILSAAKKVMLGIREHVAFFLTDCGDVHSIFVNEHGVYDTRLDYKGCVSMFRGNDYYGWATSSSVFLFGEHSGYVEVPKDWSIVSAWGGDIGYALIVNDGENDHTVLCGKNSTNKEIVIADKKFNECPLIKGSNPKRFFVKSFAQSPVKVVKSMTVPVAMIDYECVKCSYKFVNNDGKCPFCKSEVMANA